MRRRKTSIAANPLPRWRGFNLLEMFNAGGDRSAPPAFREDDFRWISDWGFDFVRLPMSYHFWSAPERWREIDEQALAPIDQAVEFGHKHVVHVSLNLHRAPGYCVNPNPPEPSSLWRDKKALTACCRHWRALARRYKGIPSTSLSFDLVNEPPLPSPERMTREEHKVVVRSLVATIREEDPDRLIVADGVRWGNDPSPELTRLKIAQSCRAYLPMGISHYQAPWVKGERFPKPAWPGGPGLGYDDRRWDRAALAEHYAQWAALMAKGVGVHCGEGGCFNRTPHAVFLTWFRDVLEVLKSLGIGYALWNFRGSFGILDSGRSDVKYEDWHGHQLDKQLLELLQEF